MMTASESTIHRRAIEAINWGMPAVKFDRMQQAEVSAGPGAVGSPVSEEEPSGSTLVDLIALLTHAAPGDVY